MTQIISFINHKGGVGKTTSVQNIGVALSRKKKKVLLIDLDPQANLTLAFDIKEPVKTISDFLNGDTDCITKKGGVDFIPSDLSLFMYMQNIINSPDRENILKSRLEKIKSNYDYILIDCPPAINVFTFNSLTASDYCFIPLLTETFAFKGIETIFLAVDTIKERLNKNLKTKIFFTRTKSRGFLSNLVQDKVKENPNLKDLALKTKIRENIKLSECIIYGKSIFDYEPKSNGAVDYKNLTNEIINLK